jgi:putative FmdB family regulatory protein
MGAMPTYEYVCAEGHAFELVQRMSDKPVRKCPTCGAKAERKLSGGAGLIFKGSGFYITDYRSEGYKDAAKKGEGSSTASEAKSESKSDTTATKTTDSKSKSEAKPHAPKKSESKKK